MSKNAKLVVKQIKSAINFLVSQNPNYNKKITLPVKVYENQIYLGPLKIGKINTFF